MTNTNRVLITPDLWRYLTANEKGAVFTLHNEATGKHFTYKLQKKTKVWWIYVMTGPNREWTYAGFLHYNHTNEAAPRHYKVQEHNQITATSPSMVAFLWVWELITRPVLPNLPDCLHIYHQNSCFVCGRPLTTPESCRLAVGPVCLENLG